MTLASASTDVSDVAVAPRRGGRGLRRFARHRLALIGACTILFLVIAAAIGPYINP